MSKRANWTEERRAHENDLSNARRAAKARERRPELPPYKPRAPRGPSGSPPTPHLHNGLDLAGQSVFTNKAGEVSHWDLGRRAPKKGAPIPESWAAKKISVHVRSDGGEYARHVQYKPDEVERFAEFERAVQRVIEIVPAIAPVEPPARTSGDLLTVLPYGDPHLGMLSWGEETGVHHDLHIATRDLDEASAQLIEGAPDSERFVIVDLGDFFHAQDDLQRTPTSGHKLDVDSRFAKIFDAGLLVLRKAIDRALRRFRQVEFYAIPGNHDPQMAFMIASMLRAWYRDEPRVHISPSRKTFAYVRHGLNLLGFNHGPSMTAINRLPGVMAVDRAKDWGETVYRRWHIGDIHHDSIITLKEHPGVTIESHRTMAPRDAWHDRSGYRSGQALKTITYHSEFGEVERRTIGLQRVRAALATE